MTDTSGGFSFPDAAERRVFMDRVGRGIGRYIPPEMRPLLGFVAESTPSAALERAGAASMEMAAPDRTAMERLGSLGAMLSETAGVAAPMVAAPRAAIPASEALQEALLGASVGARSAGQGFVERMNRPGDVPVMYSGFDPEAIIRALRGRAEVSDSVRFYEDQVAGGVAEDVARDRAINRFGIDPVTGAAARGSETDPVAQQLADLGYDPFLPGFQPNSPSDAMGLTEDVYHYTQGPANFDEFSLSSRSLGGLPQDWMGVHVGSPQAAEDRFLNFREFPDIDTAQEAAARGASDAEFGATMPLRARVDRPFLNPETNEPFTESELRDFLETNVIGQNRNRQGAILDFRRILAERGFTDIPYVNDFEDAGNLSRIMLTDRPEGSPAVLRSRFARFDPRFASSRNLMAGLGGAGVVVAASDDEEEPAVRGYMEGGEVMMRGNMSKQLEGGIGGFAEDTKNMFRGPRGLEGFAQYMQAGGEVGRGQGQGSTVGRPVSGPAAGTNLGADDEFLTSVRNRVIAQSGIDPIKVAMEEGVDPDLFLRLVAQESGGRADAQSDAGAYGFTQLMDATARELGVDRTDPEQNLRGGARYLRQQLDTFQEVPLALAAYNAGPNAVRRFGGIPPYSETRAYVARILGVPGGEMGVSPPMRPDPIVPTPRPAVQGPVLGADPLMALGQVVEQAPFSLTQAPAAQEQDMPMPQNQPQQTTFTRGQGQPGERMFMDLMRTMP